MKFGVGEGRGGEGVKGEKRGKKAEVTIINCTHLQLCTYSTNRVNLLSHAATKHRPALRQRRPKKEQSKESGTDRRDEGRGKRGCSREAKP
jgi:hypothetical protein